MNTSAWNSGLTYVFVSAHAIVMKCYFCTVKWGCSYLFHLVLPLWECHVPFRGKRQTLAMGRKLRLAFFFRIFWCRTIFWSLGKKEFETSNFNYTDGCPKWSFSFWCSINTWFWLVNITGLSISRLEKWN